MTLQQGLAFGILAGTLVLFVWGRWRYDVVAVLALLAVTMTGLVPADEAFQGFAHPAVITVAAVLIISRGLLNAGLIDFVVRAIAPLRGRENLQLATQCVTIAVLSAFMNNVGALALMLPVALQNAYRGGYSPSKTLMPLAFASLLGGLVTLIGTPPNLIVASFRPSSAGAPFGMFDFTPVGLLVAAAGLVFLVLVGWRLIPINKRNGASKTTFIVEDYISEATIPDDSKAVGITIAELEALVEEDVVVVGLIRDGRRRLVPEARMRLRAADIVVLRGDTDSIKAIIDAGKLTLLGDEEFGREELRSEEVDLYEAVVTPNSPLSGRSSRIVRLRTVYGVNLLAVARQGHAVEERLSEVEFRAGDVLLLQAPRKQIADTLRSLGCLPLAERPLGFDRQRRLALGGGLFSAAIALVVTGLLPVHVAFICVAAIYVVTGIIRVSDIYSSVDWPVIVLLGAMFPVGGALQSTGATSLIAGSIIGASAGLGVTFVLLILLIVTMFVSDVINNNATAVLMAPIAVTVAETLGANPDPFLMAVAIGASSAFLTPIGHQANTLVMEPGGYRFQDYWRVGLPLEVVIVAVALPAILLIWPP